jgi:hypothetical protein
MGIFVRLLSFLLEFQGVVGHNHIIFNKYSLDYVIEDKNIKNVKIYKTVITL